MKKKLLFAVVFAVLSSALFAQASGLMFGMGAAFGNVTEGAYNKNFNNYTYDYTTQSPGISITGYKGLSRRWGLMTSLSVYQPWATSLERKFYDNEEYQSATVYKEDEPGIFNDGYRISSSSGFLGLGYNLSGSRKDQSFLLGPGLHIAGISQTVLHDSGDDEIYAFEGIGIGINFLSMFQISKLFMLYGTLYGGYDFMELPNSEYALEVTDDTYRYKSGFSVNIGIGLGIGSL